MDDGTSKSSGEKALAVNGKFKLRDRKDEKVEEKRQEHTRQFSLTTSEDFAPNFGIK
jgi:hypothetical protein